MAKNRQPFIYGSPPIFIPSGGSATVTIAVTREAAFYCEKIQVEGENCALIVRDSTEDRQWFNIAIHKELLNAWKPSEPRYVYPGAVVTIEVANLSVNSNEVRIGLFGFKDYADKALKKVRKLTSEPPS